MHAKRSLFSWQSRLCLALSLICVPKQQKKKVCLQSADLLWTICIQYVYTLLLWVDKKPRDLLFIDVSRARKQPNLSLNPQPCAQIGEDMVILWLFDWYITSRWRFPWRKFIVWWGEICRETKDPPFQSNLLASTCSTWGNVWLRSDIKSWLVSVWQVPARRTKHSSAQRQNLTVDEQGSIENLHWYPHR